MQNNLIVNALAENSNENIQKFSKLVKSSKCEVSECQLRVMGQFLSAIYLFSGPWEAIAKIEDNLNKLENEENITIQKKRTDVEKIKNNYVVYAIDIIGPDETNIIFDIIDLMLTNSLVIKSMSSNSYKHSETTTNMFELHTIVYISLDSSIAGVRSEFTELCDQFNLDIIMEPLK